MALERRQRDILGAFVNATSTEHEDKFCGHHRHIQSGKRLVRIDQIRTTSPTSVLVLTHSFDHGGEAFPAPQDS